MSGPIGASSWMYGITPPFYDYTIDQSVRMSDADNTTLQWTAGTPSSTTTWTMSVWMKKYNPAGGQAAQEFFSAGTSGSAYSFFSFTSNQYFTHQTELPGARNKAYDNRRFRDPSSWFHLVLRADLSETTQDDRLKLYINGELQTSTSDGVSQTSWSFINANTVSQNWGGKTGIANGNPGCDFYLADINFCDGQSYAPTEFGETKNGVWIPKDPSVTYGNNGYRLEFKQTGTGQNASGIGADTSGNGNHFAVSGIDASDIVLDSPTNIFATWNPLQPQGAAQTTNTLSEGNLKAANNANAYGQSMTNMSVLSGKWYTETYVNDTGYPSWHIGWTYGKRFEQFTGGTNTDDVFAGFGYFTGSNVYFSSFGEGYAALQKPWSGIWSAARAPTTGDVIGCAADFDNGKFWWSINGEWLDVGSGAGDPSNDSNPARTFTVATYADEYKSPWVMNYNGSFILNAGQDSTFAGAISAGGNSDENGVGNFKYSVPSGFLALTSSSLPEPAIGPNSDTQADDYFNTVLYTGNGNTGQTISGVGFQPDWVWLKNRNLSGGYQHILNDSVRGAGITLRSNTTDVESDRSTIFTAFTSDGFTLGSGQGDSWENDSSGTYVAWNWKSGGTAVNNTDGTNITSSISANPDAGFSIVSWTGTGVGSDSVGHGLTQKPEMVICKARTSAGVNYWHVNHKDLTASDYNIFLNLTSAETDVNTNYAEGGIGLGNANVIDFIAGYSGANNVANCNNNGTGFIAYCFHSVEGYSRVSSYKGNNSTDGTFVYTGFRPAWVMVKCSSSSQGGNANWRIQDNRRLGYNPEGKELYADLALPEASNSFDIVSNGFKIRNNSSGYNASGATYIYLAFAEVPQKFANAR